MRSFHRRAFAFALLAATALSAAIARAKDYEIRIVRPTEVGTKYKLSAEGALLRKTTIKMNDETKRQPEQGFGIRLEGVVEVLEVDAKKQEKKIACTIDRCVKVTGTGEVELLKEGAVLLAEGDGKETNFSVKEGKLPDDAAEALDVVISNDADENSVSDEDVFGSAARQKPGDTWNINPAAAAEMFTSKGTKVGEDDVSGTMTVERVETVNDQQCLRLSGTLTARNMTPPLPEGMKPESGTLEAKLVGAFPIDLETGTLAESLSMTMRVVVKTMAERGVPAMTIETKVERAVDVKRTFLK